MSLRDGIQGRAARVAKAVERARRHRVKLRAHQYKRSVFNVVGIDGNLVINGARDLGGVDDPGDTLLITIQAVAPGQFLPNPETHCADGTPIPFDVLDEVGREMFRAAYVGAGVVFFDQSQSEAACNALRDYQRAMNPPPELGRLVKEPQGQSEHSSSGAPASSVVEFDEALTAQKFLSSNGVQDRLSPEAREELTVFEKFRETFPTISSWFAAADKPDKPMNVARPVAMPKPIGIKRKKANDGPPPDTEWAKMLKRNEARRIEHEQRKLAAIDERKAADARARAQTRVTD